MAPDSTRRLPVLVRWAHTYFTVTIWRPVAPATPLGPRILRRASRFGYLMVRGFQDDRVLVRAPALTLFTLLALVPLLALVLAVANGFGFQDLAMQQVRKLLMDFVAVGQRNVVEMMIGYVEHTSFATLGGLGLLFLIYTSVSLLTSIESSFNDIWGVDRARPLHRKLADYTSVLLISPVLLVTSTGVTASLTAAPFFERLRDYGTFAGALALAVKLLPVLALGIAFSFLYKFMPYTTVHVRAAVIAGFVSGIAWQGAQWAFIRFQIGVIRNNLIYGSFAALPVFLIWLNVSWIIVLVGCEIAYAVQHESTYHPPVPQGLVSIAQRERSAMQIVALVWERFTLGRAPQAAGDIAAEVDLPRPVTLEVVRALIDCGLLARATAPEDCLLPARDLARLSVGELLHAYRHAGRTEHGDRMSLYSRVEHLHENLEQVLRAEGSQPVASLLRPSQG